ncbi:MAG TPA: glycoside hydrolase family 2 TIM barrel-domain containing protein [Acidobacteriaceae bacterium]|jgi:beta-galactosidase|nr:glycoside hydrolase family 2 TIM barrel-domain containing protein [Acidobacteriaceae bacterium]
MRASDPANEPKPGTTGVAISRRSFVKGGASLAAAASVRLPLLASVLQNGFAPNSPGDPKAGVMSRTLTDWEYYQGPLDPRFQVWHSEEIAVWQPVSLPHCFNHYDACDPETPAYRGQGWYRTQLAVNNPIPGGRTFLHFEGAGQQSEIWIGTKRVGQHTGGYDEFLIDITDACRVLPSGAEVPLAVLCDNGRNIERLPSDLSDFTLYGGLYRAVHLVSAPAVSLEAVHTRICFEPGQRATVQVTARLYAPEGAAGPLRFEVALFDPQGQRVFRQTVERSAWEGENELAHCVLEKPQLWSPQSPSLYRCEVSLSSHAGDTAASHRFGVRHTRFEPHGPFYLNGERLLLRGTHRHQDHAGCAAAMSDDLMRQEMQLIRDMGANFIRLAHYQQPRTILDLCDELGILVWEEVPWCRSGVGNERFRQQGREKLHTMIDQHSNHAAVLVWGLGNEDDWPTELNGADHDAIRAYMTELRDLAHQSDPTRLTAFRRCGFACDIPDVYSPSIWAGWYSGRYTEYQEALEQARRTVPHFLHMEWGADSHAGRHAEDPDPAVDDVPTGRGTAETGFAYKNTGGSARVSRDGDWTETYACDLFDWYLKTLDELPWMTGAAQWAFKDFATALRSDNPIPRINQKGLVTRDLTLKESYFVFQSYWAEKPMVHLYGHSWPVRWGKPGERRRVRVYSNCSAVELFLNGDSAGVKKRDPQDFPAAGLRWSLPFREGENELRAVARGRNGNVEDRIRFRYQTRQWSAPVRLMLAVAQQEAGKTTVEAQLVDAAGVRCLDSRALVSFSLAGDGRLEDNLGTPTGSRVVEMYNGRVQISLTHAGPVVAGVHSAGVEAAFLHIPAS